jgi:hypothetical protein
MNFSAVAEQVLNSFSLCAPWIVCSVIEEACSHLRLDITQVNAVGLCKIAKSLTGDGRLSRIYKFCL